MERRGSLPCVEFEPEPADEKAVDAAGIAEPVAALKTADRLPRRWRELPIHRPAVSALDSQAPLHRGDHGGRGFQPLLLGRPAVENAAFKTHGAEMVSVTWMPARTAAMSVIAAGFGSRSHAQVEQARESDGGERVRCHGAVCRPRTSAGRDRTAAAFLGWKFRRACRAVCGTGPRSGGRAARVLRRRRGRTSSRRRRRFRRRPGR